MIESIKARLKLKAVFTDSNKEDKLSIPKSLLLTGHLTMTTNFTVDIYPISFHDVITD